MATQAQYQCFKDIYDREAKRAEYLIDRGKTYLTIITIYMGLLSVSADKIISRLAAHRSAVYLYALSLICFIASLSLLIFSIGIYKYIYPTNPENIIHGFTEEPPNDEDFFDDRIIEFSVAFRHNINVNEKRANLLKYASWFMLFGISCQAYVLLAIITF